MRIRPASLLNCVRCIKSASGYQNIELKTLMFLRSCLTDAMFSNARSMSLFRDTRSVSLYQIARLMNFVFLNYSQASTTIDNTRFASLLNRGTGPASQSQNARAASVPSNVSSASLNPAPLRCASQSCDARLTFTLRWLRSEGC